MLSTALEESKHQLLQKMAGTVDRPACKQLEVCFMRKDLLLRVEAGISVLLVLNVIHSTSNRASSTIVIIHSSSWFPCLLIQKQSSFKI